MTWEQHFFPTQTHPAFILKWFGPTGLTEWLAQAHGL